MKYFLYLLAIFFLLCIQMAQGYTVTAYTYDGVYKWYTNTVYYFILYASYTQCLWMSFITLLWNDGGYGFYTCISKFAATN